MIIPTLLAILLAVFVLLSFMNDTRAAEFGIEGNGDLLDRFYQAIDAQPNAVTRFGRYAYDLVFKFKFGPDRFGEDNLAIRTEIFFRVKFTLALAGFGFLASMLIGVPLGFIAGMHKGRIQDHAISIGSLLLASIPSYCLAVLVMVVFCLWLRLLPVYGYSNWYSYIMPTIVISAGGIALTTRMTRSAVLDVINKQYITVLRAKRLSPAAIRRHILKNSFVAIASTLNNLASSLICGTLICENFFSFPGLGQMIIRVINARNQHAVLGTIAVVALILIVINIIADLICALLNPQIRFQYSENRTKRL